MNILTLTDSYKVSHYRQYPPNSEHVYAYFESRGGLYKKTVAAGMQYYRDKYIAKPITMADIDAMESLVIAHLGPGAFNRAGWEYILRVHGGYLPIEIKAVPEGTVLSSGNILMSVENTDKKVPWLTNYVESLLVKVWYPTTVASTSYYIKQLILEALEKSGDPSLITFKLHDFGDRGVSSPESAAIGGVGHLFNFRGTDTLTSLDMARTYYGCDMAGFSIPASEHSTITSWGREHEVDAYRNMLHQYPEGSVACVSDSYDIYNACENLWGGVLKEEVLARDGVLVIRPDSGDPQEVLPKMLDILGDKFGYTPNRKGYKVLNDKVRVIQGDGVTPQSIPLIMDAVMNAGWSIDNIAFGSGGGLLQKMDRDTLKFAFKCSSIIIDGEPRDVFKQPITAAWKSSKAGRLKLTQDKGIYKTVREEEGGTNLLRTIYRNGEAFNTDNLDTIRQRTESKVY